MGGGRSLAGSFVWPMGLVGLGLCLSGRSFFSLSQHKNSTRILFMLLLILYVGSIESPASPGLALGELQSLQINVSPLPGAK